MVAGTMGTVSLPKEDLANVSGITSVNDTYVMLTNLANQQVFALGDVDGEYLNSSGELHCLIPIDPFSGVRDTTKRVRWLTEAIAFDLSSGVYSGYNRVIITSSTTLEAFSVSLLNGRVVQVEDSISRSLPAADWVTSGILSYSLQRTNNLLYRSAAGLLEQQELETQNLQHGADDIILGDDAAICADSSDRWYYFYGGIGSFSNGIAVLGYADMYILQPQPTSQPSSVPSLVGSDDDVIYDILQLTTDNPIVFSVVDIIGEATGTIGVSSSRVFVSGSLGTVGFLKFTTSEYIIIEESYTIVTNLANQDVFALGNADGEFLTTAGELHCLVPLNPSTGIRNEARRILWLTVSFPLFAGSSLYSGYNRVLFLLENSMEIFHMDLLNGKVTQLEDSIVRGPVSSHWVKAGLASFNNQKQNELLYSGSGGIEKIIVGPSCSIDHTDTTLLGDSAAIAADSFTNQWYYYYNGIGTFGIGLAQLGSATMLVNQGSAVTYPPYAEPTSFPSISSSMTETVFDIFLLSTANAAVVDISALIGDFAGGIAVSSSRVFLSGTLCTVSLSKNNLSEEGTILNANLTLISNTATQQIYAFGDQYGEFLLRDGEILYCLIALDPVSGTRDETQRIVWLTEQIYLSLGFGVYAGYNVMTLVNRATLESFSVNMRNGRVTMDVSDILDRFVPTPGVGSWGIVESSVQLVRNIFYSGPSGTVEMQAGGMDRTIKLSSEILLGFYSSMVADASNSRWYFAYQGAGTFGHGYAVVGYADLVMQDAVAEYVLPTSQPTSFPSLLDEEDFESFDVHTYKSTIKSAIQIADLIGDSHGTMAVSTSRVFVSGSMGIVGLQKANLTSEDVVIVGSNYSVVTNIANQQIYGLGNQEADFLLTSGELDCLIPLHHNTGVRDYNKRILWLTEPVLLSLGSVLYSGYNVLATFDPATGECSHISLRNGRVHTIENTLARLEASAGWIRSGLALGSAQQITSFSSAAPTGTIEHQTADSYNDVSTPSTISIPGTAGISADFNTSHWYVLYDGIGDFGTSSAVVGCADTTKVGFSPSSAPSSQPPFLHYQE